MNKNATRRQQCSREQFAKGERKRP